MFVLVMIACMTLDDRTACQSFERDLTFQSEKSCVRAAAMEEGRYAERRAKREWVKYTWVCRNGGDQQAAIHRRGRSAD